jgi:hypothetical protein
MMLSLACAVSACHTAPPKDHTVLSTAPSPPAELPPPSTSENEVSAPDTDAMKADSAEAPTCSCVDNAAKPPPKRKPKPLVHTPPPTAPAAAPAQPDSGDASVKVVDSSSASVLGRKVRTRDGEDLGRLVDVLADQQGRVRIAVIEFGGFLGVGNRRIAVDWSLLKFQPGDEDAPIMLDASKSKLQGMPEYKGTERPLALMAPAAPASPPSTAPK